jgi:hypothetical protein
VRDLPDVSLTAAGHDPYLLCLEGSCVPDSQGELYVYFISGTSASAPSFAGIMALVDDKTGQANTLLSRQGAPNYILYRLAATQSSYPSQCNGSNTSTPPATTCLFNDITVGNNVVPGEVGTEYQANAGYDLTTGLGSVNVTNLVSQWSTVTFNPTTTTLSLGASSINHGTPMPFSISVTPNSGTGVTTGDAFVLAYTGPLGEAPTSIGFWTLSGGSVSANTSTLPGGNYLLTARYAGNETYAPSTSVGSSYITVNPEASTTTLSILTADQYGNPIPFTSGPFGSFVYLRADVAGASGKGIPTGGVTFLDGGSPIVDGSLLLNSEGNTATPNGILNFDSGTHTISASYSGDNSFNASASAPPITLTITPGFFATIPTSASQVSISAPGSSGVTSATVSNSTGFNGTISLACIGLPSEASCTFSPATVSAHGTPSTTTASIMVTTTAATATLTPQRRRYLPAQWILGVGLLLSIALVSGQQQRARGLFLLLTLVLLFVVPSCGGGGGSGGGGSKTPPPNPGTPTGVTNVVVTATSGSTVSQTSFTLSVQ